MEESVPEQSAAVHELVRFLSLFSLRRGRTDFLRNTTGSNVIVAGTALFGASDPAAVMVDMKEKIEGAKAAWGTKEALAKA